MAIPHDLPQKGGKNHPQMTLVYGIEVNNLPHSWELLIVRNHKTNHEASIQYTQSTYNALLKTYCDYQ